VLAVDINGLPIKCTTVKKVIEEATGADTRETILGHVQRGGAPSALDRYTVCHDALEVPFSCFVSCAGFLFVCFFSSVVCLFVFVLLCLVLELIWAIC
jgi:hypothetical protein